jgi:hypothetical protein
MKPADNLLEQCKRNRLAILTSLPTPLRNGMLSLSRLRYFWKSRVRRIVA